MTANDPAAAPGRICAASLVGFVADVAHEEALLREIAPGQARPDGPRWPGLLTLRHPPALPDPAFALQVLPAATQVRGESVAELARAADLVLADRLEAGEGPILLHTFVPDRIAYRNVAGRAALLDEAFVEHLRGQRRRVSRRVVRTLAPGAAPFAEHLVVQLALVGRTSLLVSAAQPRALPSGGFDIFPLPAGSAPVPEDRTAPSRAYRKLVESFAWLGDEPRAGQSCVDLGGAPGGWAHTALVRGAQVTAVDRSPLAPPAAGHPGLTMVIGNAFTFRPPAPVDWLLCDVICEPHKTVDLVERWVDAGLCRRVLATLKFKGDADYAVIAAARTRLGAKRWPFVRIKHLRNHHNEAVVMMAR